MNIESVIQNGMIIGNINSDEIVITDAQSALDLIATVGFETGCQGVIINKEAIAEDFFVLSTGIAGEILQKFVNYRFKLAIVGDFSYYTGKALKDFIYESNKGRHIFFVKNKEEGIEKLSQS